MCIFCQHLRRPRLIHFHVTHLHCDTRLVLLRAFAYGELLEACGHAVEGLRHVACGDRVHHFPLSVFGLYHHQQARDVSAVSCIAPLNSNLCARHRFLLPMLKEALCRRSVSKIYAIGHF
jgi:hypothetical protein